MLAFDDISIRKEIEKVEKTSADNLKMILGKIPQITMTASADGSVTYFNEFFLDYSGLTFAEAIGRGWEPLIQPEMLDDVKKAWSHSVRTGEDFSMDVLIKRKSDGKYRWHLSRASAVRDDDGKVISWVGAATDIHDQKAREEVKDDFIGIASHELKTPLTTAKAYVQLLEMSLAETNYKDLIFAQKAGSAIDRLNDLIGELMDVSKIQNGNLDLHITSFNFNEMVADAIEQVQHASPVHHLNLSGAINEPVKADKERLKQVIINFLSNAVKYSPKSKDVFINVEQNSSDIMVSVKDEGIGIRKENIKKIFERYYREEQQVVHFQGLGIGLFISYEIVQRHHGKVWAVSEPGKGTTFYFSIPISQ